MKSDWLVATHGHSDDAITQTYATSFAAEGTVNENGETV